MSTEQQDGIAIIGMAGRFPGAGNVSEFWKNLVSGAETIATLTSEQLESAGFDAAELHKDPSFVAARGLLERPEWFDAAFFGITPKEAEVMDPQQRVFLEEAWRALEDAGIDPARSSNSIGVFAGMSNNTYFQHNVAHHPDLIEAVGQLTAMMGNEKDYLATRTAYKLNLRGPALNIYTACSTSLVAVCQAVTALQNYQCDVALAGGVSITFPQERGYYFHEGGITSPDGHCRTFDATAAGTVFSSGVGIVALKRAAEALADGDQIYAVIKGAALNNDGSSKVSFTAPSVDGHAEVIALAHALADFEPETISYVEAHGTATPLGDPVEIAGLTQAFRAGTARKQFCAIGSVKTNIGHLDAAAGIAGLIKTALALKHGILPASLHFRSANPKLELEESPFFVNAELRAWEGTGGPRRAGVSSFGVGGTNAHVVLEEAPTAPDTAASRPVQVMPLAARTSKALDEMTDALALAWGERSSKQSAGHDARTDEDAHFADVAFSLQTGRHGFNHRRFFVARDVADAAAACHDSKRLLGREQTHRDVPVALMFPGQGAQVAGMGAALYASEPLFRHAIDDCAEVLRRELECDLREVLFVPGPDAAARLQQTRFTQPALFAVEYALARLWMERGLHPDAMIGHSVGEYVAATLSGVFSVQDALQLVAARARLVQSQPGGAMLAVRLPEAELQGLLRKGLSVAAVNSEKLCVASGDYAAIGGLETDLRKRGIAARRLQTSHAFHSEMMAEVIAPFTALLREVPLHAPNIPFVSNVTGDWITESQARSVEYWAAHVREPVRFARGVTRLFETQPRVLLECGPGQTLSQLARQHPSKSDRHDVIASLDGPDENVGLATATGRLWLAGVTIEWAALHSGETRRRVSLPTYPFQRQRYWAEPLTTARERHRPQQMLACAAAESKAAAEEVTPSQRASNGELPTDDPGKTGSEALLADIIDELQKVSGMDFRGADHGSSFTELGFDSLFLTQVALALQRRFGMPITFRRLLEDAPTPASLAEWLFEQGGSDSARRHIPAAEASEARVITHPARARADAPAAHGPFRRIDVSAAPELTPSQARHLRDLINRYTARTARSKTVTDQHRAYLADPRAVAGFKRSWKEMVYPVVCQRSLGSKLWDVDGNEYVDVTLGFGQNLLGHRPPFVVEAIERQLQLGMEIGPTSPLAGEVAALMCEFTRLERVAFCNTGSEAVTAALRVARTVTGRSKIAIFAGAYHGIFDEVLVRPCADHRAFPIAPGIESNAVENVVLLDYGTDEALATLRAHAHELAAVVVEPVQSRRPDLQPREFLQELRRITADAGSALVFDEVVTGFRCHPGGAQAWFGVTADIATYGKVVGGGLPIGIICGAARFMDALDGGAWRYGDDSFPEKGVTFFAGTFVRHPLALASAKAVLEHLRQAGPALQENLNTRAAELVEQLNAHLLRRAVPLQWTRFSSMFFLGVPPELKHASLLWYHLRELGIHAWESRPSFISTAHSDEDLSRIVETFASSVDALIDGGFLPAKHFYQRESRHGGAAAVDLIPITDGQQELLLAARLSDEASASFNESVTLRLKGAVDAERLKRALNDVIARHESLRTSFPVESGQRVQDALTIEVPIVDLSSASAEAQRTEARKRQEEESVTPFDLSAGPLIRARLLRLGAERHELIVTAHHSVCDGWSFGVGIKELAALYRAHQNEQRVLPAATQFREYVRWAREQQSENAKAYWVGEFADVPPPLNLPTDRPRGRQRSYEGGRCEVQLSRDLLDDLKRVAAQERATLFTTMLAGFHVLLHRLSGETDIVVGIASAGQAAFGHEILVGHCLNFLPIRAGVSGSESFAGFLAALKRRVLDGFEHQHFTFGTLIQQLELPRDASRMPLLGATFNIDRSATGLDFGADVHAEFEINPKHRLGIELSFNVIETDCGTQLYCAFNRDLFNGETISRWLDYYVTILRGVAAQPSLPISRIPLLNPDERTRIVVDWNKTSRDYPQDPIHRQFEEWVRRSPSAQAVIDAGHRLSYRELDQRAERIAVALRAHGLQAGAFVGVRAERSIDFVVELLGILKAGGAYLPLDPTLPAERLEALRKACALILNDSQPEPCAAEPVARMEVTGDSPAYVLFTSGSTGTPKGVVVPHRAITRLVVNSDYVRLGPPDLIAFASNVCFDAATFEIWGALLNGGTIVITPPEVLLSPAALERHLATHGVTTLFLTTALFNEFAQLSPSMFRGLRNLLFGGEAADPKSVCNVLRADSPARLLNIYGPTETTAFALWHLCTNAHATQIPLGRPIANTTAYVLDADLEPVPIGVAGEIFLGGPGVALGYHGDVELTSHRFLSTEHGRVYRTGDRGRWLPDGNLEYLGRIDAQVKLRGFRIELGEVEAVLRQLHGVGQCAVILRTDQGQPRLVAYYTASNGSTPPSSRLREILSQSLPAFMIPDAFVAVDRMPLTRNGKVDIRALPAPAEERRTTVDAPVTLLDAQLLELWQQLLPGRRIGIRDSFFEIGGHSLLAVRMLALLAERTGVRLPLPVLFEHPTIASLAEHLLTERREGAAARPFTPMNVEGTKVPFFFFHGDFHGGGFYSQELAREIGPDRPFYAIHPHGLIEEALPASIAEMAYDRLKTIRALQPRGPYLLGGYCNGALVAYETACLLEAAGERVETVLMLVADGSNFYFRHLRKVTDALGGEFQVRNARFIRWRRHALFAHAAARAYAGKARDFMHADAQTKITRGLHKMRRIVRRLRGLADPATVQPDAALRAPTDVYDRFSSAVESYVPGRFSGEVALFWPEAEEPLVAGKPAFGWEEACNSVRLLLVPGTHDSCITSPINLRELAAQMCSVLDGSALTNTATRAFAMKK